LPCFSSSLLFFLLHGRLICFRMTVELGGLIVRDNLIA
jgi:hypothetical protein